MRTVEVGMLALFGIGLLASTSAAQPWRDGDGERRTPQTGQNPLMEALDVDKDGAISATEVEAAATTLKTLDKNEDGRLTWDEVEPAQAGSRTSERDRPERQSLEQPPLSKTESEKRILGVLDDLDRNYRRGMNISVTDGRLLRLLTESIGAKHVVELGTYNGYSALWLCMGLKVTGGKLTTYEINEDFASEARENFERAGVEKSVTIVVGDAHQETKNLTEPIDLLFIDADKEGYVYYLKRLLPLVRPGGLIVGHNMVRPPPDPRYIEAITTNPDLETVFLLMDGAGVGVTMKKH